ncbi:MAG: SDR family oxidoreductase, partial [Chloroflexota bacterium]
EFCRTLAEAGAAVTIADMNGAAAEELAGSLKQRGLRALAVQTDVTAVGSVAQMIDATIEHFGGVDILVNSAALDPKFDPHTHQTQSGAFEDFPLALWRQALDVNLTGMFLVSQAAVVPMLEQESGVIINIASMYGVAAPDQRLYQRDGQSPQFKPVYYTVTKAGTLGLTKYLAAYYAGKNIRVNTLTPGGVYNDHDDEFLDAYAARSILGRMAEKDEMNGALLFLASDASKYMTGANLIVDGGWTTW